MKINKHPDTGDTLWLSDDSFYLPPPPRHRSDKRTYVTALLVGALVTGFMMVGPLLEWIGAL